MTPCKWHPISQPTKSLKKSEHTGFGSWHFHNFTRTTFQHDETVFTKGRTLHGISCWCSGISCFKLCVIDITHVDADQICPLMNLLQLTNQENNKIVHTLPSIDFFLTDKKIWCDELILMHNGLIFDDDVGSFLSNVTFPRVNILKAARRKVKAVDVCQVCQEVRNEKNAFKKMFHYFLSCPTKKN